MQHRARVKAESADLQKELKKYFDAESGLVEDQISLEGDNTAQITELQKLDLQHAALWEDQWGQSRDLYENEKKYLSNLNGLHQKQMKEKHLKEAQPLIEANSSIAFGDLKAQRFARGCALCHKIVDQGRAQAAVAVLGQERNVHEPG